MEDEKYVFFQDLREKKVTGYSARKQRSHCGKGGRVKLPSDYLTKKELQNMSGECKSYRLNEPMKWDEFKEMPDDIKETYVKLLRQKFGVPNRHLAVMFGVSDWSVCQELKRIGLGIGKGKHNREMPFDRDGFYAWRNGVSVANSEEEVKEEMPFEETPAKLEQEVIEEETAVLEYVPEPIPADHPLYHNSECKVESPLLKKCVPTTGSMTFEGLADDILMSIGGLLGGAKVLLSVKWDVLED